MELDAPLTQHTAETFQANITAAYDNGWNAAIEAAAGVCEIDAQRYAHIGNLRYDSLHEEAAKLGALIRALRRPVTP